MKSLRLPQIIKQKDSSSFILYQRNLFCFDPIFRDVPYRELDIYSIIDFWWFLSILQCPNNCIVLI